MNFGEILSKSWKIIWKNKILWLFGLLAGCSGGMTAQTNFNFSSSNFQFSGRDYSDFDYYFKGFERFFESPEFPILLIITIILVIFILSIISFFVGTYGRVGLFRGAWDADESEEKLTFAKVHEKGWPYFWKVLLLSFLAGLVSFFGTFILILPFILLTVLTLGIGLICMIPIMLILNVFVSVFLNQTIIAMIGEDLSMMDGLKRAWGVITDDLGTYIIMTLILGVGAGIIGFIISLPAILVMMPIVFGIIAETRAALTGSIVATVILLLLYLPVAWFANALIQSYVGTAWTLTFKRVTGKNLPDKPVLIDNGSLPESLSDSGEPLEANN
jgi:hypothetical protein